MDHPVFIHIQIISGKSKRHENGVTRHFLQLSDTHLDIYYNSNITNKLHQGCRNVPKRSNNSTNLSDMHSERTAEFGRFQCDAPTRLMISVQDQIKNVARDMENGIDFLILTGNRQIIG